MPPSLPVTPARELLHRCAARDEAAWWELVSVYTPLLERAVYEALRQRGVTPQRDQIQDLVQDTYCRLIAAGGRKLRAFQGESEQAIRLWLVRVATWTAADALRALHAKKRGGGPKHRERRPHIEPWGRALWPSPEQLLLAGEHHQQILARCRRLARTPGVARLVELAVFEGWTSRELARACRGRVSTQSIDALMCRLRQQLAREGYRLPTRTAVVPSTARICAS